jgi:hypothetical protein
MAGSMAIFNMKPELSRLLCKRKTGLPRPSCYIPHCTFRVEVEIEVLRAQCLLTIGLHT